MAAPKTPKPKIKAGQDKVLDGIRRICATLPDSTEALTWGHPNWRVGGAKGKLFLGYGAEDGEASMSFKADPLLRATLLQDPRFSIAPYVGKYGWLSMDLARGKINWGEMEQLIGTSQELIAAAMPVARKKKKPVP